MEPIADFVLRCAHINNISSVKLEMNKETSSLHVKCTVIHRSHLVCSDKIWNGEFLREFEIPVITGIGCAGAVTCPVPGMPTTMPDRLVLDAEAGIPPGCVCPPPICFRGDPGDAPAISTWLEVAVSVSTTYSRCRNKYTFSKIIIFTTSLLPFMSVNLQYKVKCIKTTLTGCRASDPAGLKPSFA